MSYREELKDKREILETDLAGQGRSEVETTEISGCYGLFPVVMFVGCPLSV